MPRFLTLLLLTCAVCLSMSQATKAEERYYRRYAIFKSRSHYPPPYLSYFSQHYGYYNYDPGIPYSCPIRNHGNQWW